LSILDPNERSNQPMIDYSGRYVLVFNGEIYNYRQLKVQLDYPWKTSSDSEVLLAWLIKYGTSKLDYLEGMFAFAFYDTKLKSCILARDRFGKKPLYIHEKEGKLSFASEIGFIGKRFQAMKQLFLK
jgi:asparagine synthase (glutamine-hydrolysing)